MLNKYLSISLKGYHTLWGGNPFPQFSWCLGNERNQIKKTQRDPQRSDKCQKKRELKKLRICLFAEISLRLLPISTGQDNNGTFIKAEGEREQSYAKEEGTSERQGKVTVSVKCYSEVQ